MEQTLKVISGMKEEGVFEYDDTKLQRKKRNEPATDEHR
jgi:hypothetical protein